MAGALGYIVRFNNVSLHIGLVRKALTMVGNTAVITHRLYRLPNGTLVNFDGTGNPPTTPGTFTSRHVFEGGSALAYFDSIQQSKGVRSTLTKALFAATQSGTAQGGASNTITLNTGASASDDTYNGMYVRINSGTGDGQMRRITDYVGATKVATVDIGWTTTPTSSSTYSVHDTETCTAILEDVQPDMGSLPDASVVFLNLSFVCETEWA